MKKTIKLNLTRERLEQLCRTGSGLYRIKLPESAERLFRGSDIPLHLARKAAGLWMPITEETRNPATGALRGYFWEELLPKDLKELAGRSVCSAILSECRVACGNSFFQVNNGEGREYDCETGEVLVATTRRRACENCGAVLTTAEEKAAGLCRECADERWARVFDYHGRPDRSRPRFEYPTKRAEVLHLGAELEVSGEGCMDVDEFIELQKEQVNPFDPLYYCEHDGSLDGGVECVFKPLTYKGLAARRESIKSLYTDARGAGGAFKVLNGLHFHIDNSFLSNGKAGLFFSRVALEVEIYKYYNVFLGISGRVADRDGVAQPGYARKKENADTLTMAAARTGDCDHSYAVNTSNSNTTEIRFFGGEIDRAEDFLAAADIVNALAKWARNASELSVIKFTPKDLTRYITDAENVARFIRKMRERRHRSMLTPSEAKALEKWLAALDMKEAKKGV